MAVADDQRCGLRHPGSGGSVGGATRVDVCQWHRLRSRLGERRTVGNVTGASVDAANDRERKMIVDPACRKVFSAIEQALASA